MKIAMTYHVHTVRGTTVSPLDPGATSDVSRFLSSLRSSLLVGHEVVLVVDDSELEDRLLMVWPDIVLNLTGPRWRVEPDVTLPTLLERWHIPFAGSSARTLQLCQDRAALRWILRKKRLPTPVFTIAETPDDIWEVERFPVRVIPLYQSTSEDSASNCIVHTRHDLRTRLRLLVEAYDQPVLIETFLGGRKVTLALLGNGSEVNVLPPVEQYATPAPTTLASAPLGASPGEGRDAAPRHGERYGPATVNTELAEAMTHLARQAFATLQCADFCCVTFGLDEAQQPYILDVNPMPDLVYDPEYPSAMLTAATIGQISYPALIYRILQLACQRHGLQALLPSAPARFREDVTEGDERTA